jgi:hypothetical protein
MVVNGLDLNYLGVSNVWNNDLGLFVHPVLSLSQTDQEQAKVSSNVVSVLRRMMLSQLRRQWQLWQLS